MKTIKHTILATLLLASAAKAQTVQLPMIAPPPGFNEGTETVLSDAQTAELLPWAKNSKRDLESLLVSVDNTGTMISKKQALLVGIQSVVLLSQPLKSELLMRYVLDRALKINAIIEDEAIAKNGGVAPTGVMDQQVRLLKQSVKMAIKYYQSDLEFLNGTAKKKDVNLLAMPYAQFGMEYVQFVMDLNNSITDASAQYEVAVTALGLFQWDLYRDQNKYAFADSIVRLSAFLKSVPADAGMIDDATAIATMLSIKRKYLEEKAAVAERIKDLAKNDKK